METGSTWQPRPSSRTRCNVLPTPDSIPTDCRRTWRSSWTATAAGPGSAACRASQGHAQGVKSVRSTVEECCRLGVGQLTLYCLSSENWKRPQTELDFLMALLEQYLIEERAEILDQNIRFSVIGRRAELPEPVLREIDENIRLTHDNTGMGLCLAINYGGRTELIDAVRSLAIQVRDGNLRPNDIDEAVISNALYTAGHARPGPAYPHGRGDAGE